MLPEADTQSGDHTVTYRLSIIPQSIVELHGEHFGTQWNLIEAFHSAAAVLAAVSTSRTELNCSGKADP
jgi:hypothetical protein